MSLYKHPKLQDLGLEWEKLQSTNINDLLTLEQIDEFEHFLLLSTTVNSPVTIDKLLGDESGDLRFTRRQRSQVDKFIDFCFQIPEKELDFGKRLQIFLNCEFRQCTCREQFIFQNKIIDMYNKEIDIRCGRSEPSECDHDTILKNQISEDTMLMITGLDADFSNIRQANIDTLTYRRENPKSTHTELIDRDRYTTKMLDEHKNHYKTRPKLETDKVFFNKKRFCRKIILGILDEIKNEK